MPFAAAGRPVPGLPGLGGSSPLAALVSISAALANWVAAVSAELPASLAAPIDDSFGAFLALPSEPLAFEAYGRVSGVSCVHAR